MRPRRPPLPRSMARSKPQRCVLVVPESVPTASAAITVKGDGAGMPQAEDRCVPAPTVIHAPARALVLDTNIVLDLLVFADEAIAPVRALLAAGELRWIATHAMRGELARVLAYPQIVPRLAFYQLTAEQVLARYDAAVHWVDAAPRIAVLCKDADDQHFLDLAVAHTAILLSKDKAVVCLRKRLQVLGADVATAIVRGAEKPTMVAPS